MGPGAGRGRVLGWRISEDPSPTCRFGSLSLHPRGKETITDSLPRLSSVPGAWTTEAAVTVPSLPDAGERPGPVSGALPPTAACVSGPVSGGVCCPLPGSRQAEGRGGDRGPGTPGPTLSPPPHWAQSRPAGQRLRAQSSDSSAGARSAGKAWGLEPPLRARPARGGESAVRPGFGLPHSTHVPAAPLTPDLALEAEREAPEDRRDSQTWPPRGRR